MFSYFFYIFTKKQILLEDNGNNNISNVSNSIKSYLFNSIKSLTIPIWLG